MWSMTRQSWSLCSADSQRMLVVQIVWNSKMREEVLELMEAAREHPETAGTPQDFTFKALQVGRPLPLTLPCGVVCIAVTQKSLDTSDHPLRSDKRTKYLVSSC